MTYATEVNNAIWSASMDLIKEGESIPKEINGIVAQLTLEDLLKDEAVIREVAQDCGQEYQEIASVLRSLTVVLRGGESDGQGA